METLPVPLPRTLTVFVARADPAGLFAPALAALALRGPLTVLDGGNRFPVYRLLQVLRLHFADPLPAARQVHLCRAFTCHQMLALLQALPAAPEPTVLLDPLSTFYDEAVPLPEAIHLLEACRTQIARLRREAGVLAFVPPPRQGERLEIFERFCAAAGGMLTLEEAPPAAAQLPLF